MVSRDHARRFKIAIDDTAHYAQRLGFHAGGRSGHILTRRGGGIATPVALEQRHAGAENSSPADIRHEIERLWRADLVVLQFPIWWHAPPALLKGWFDRVFVYGELYTGRRRYDHGAFRGKRAICSVTTGGPASTFAPFGRGGSIEKLLWPVNYSLHYMGFDVLAPFVAHGIQGGGIAYQAREVFETHLETRKNAWRERLTRLDRAERIPFTGWADWTDDGQLRGDHPLRWLA